MAKENTNYETAASAASKATIFVFALTLGYLTLFSGASPGWFGGAAFFFVGIFVVSLGIAMPLFLLRARFPRAAVFVNIVAIALTIFLTRTTYLWLFEKPDAPVASSNPFVVVCPEPIPQFTLGPQSHPSKSQVNDLCACLSTKLVGWEKETAQAIAQRREADVSALNMAAFPTRFGVRIRDCGGMDL